MSANLGTRIIDGDGHIMEDNAGIIAHMEGAYREIAARKGTCFPPLDHLHSGRAVETPPQRDGRAPVGPKAGWIFLTTSASTGPSCIRPSHYPTARSSVAITP